MSQSRASGALVALPLSGPVASFEPFLTTYLLFGGKTALVDPGPQAYLPQLLSGLAEAGLKPGSIDYILLTHVHIDHAGGVGGLMPRTPGARVVVHPGGLKHMANPERLWQASLNTLGEVAVRYGEIKPVPLVGLVAAEDGMKLDLGGRYLEVIFTPGHAPHHISFWDKVRGELFVGDAVGVYHPALDVITPGTPPPFDLPKALESLEKLASLRPRVICYPHGGPVPDKRRTLERARKQLLVWQEVVSRTFRQRPEDILKILLDEDEELDRLTKTSKSEFEKETFFPLNSVRGFIGYFKSRAESS